jgi:hypothetical protein
MNECLHDSLFKYLQYLTFININAQQTSDFLQHTLLHARAAVCYPINRACAISEAILINYILKK